MLSHSFILQPGTWEGEGTIAFSASPDELAFKTEWSIENVKNGLIIADQTVWIQGAQDPVKNNYVIYDISKNAFKITLKNKILGKVPGIAIIDSKTIAWEFRNSPEFDGFEIYKTLKENTYSFHAEYSSPDQFRTIIDGKIER